MLRALVVLLILVNLVFWVWAQGWLDGFTSMRATGDREPERMARQVRPQTLRILPPAAASSSALESRPACLEAGPFAEDASSRALAYLHEAVPGVVPTSSAAAAASQWAIVMGRFAAPESMLKKEDELKRRNVKFEELRSPPELVPGLSLGRFDDRDAAQRALDELEQKGIRTARTVELPAVKARQMLRYDKVDAALAAKLRDLQSPALGSGFSACAVAGPGQ